MAPRPEHHRSEQDFTAFYDATWGRTVACAYVLTGDLASAEDLAQEAYSRAWPRWSSLRDYDDPGAWVRQVATRAAISGWRRRRTALLHLARQRPPEHTPPPGETSLELIAALRRVPEAQRRSIVLHHLAGLPVTQVAALERCPEGTVKARLSRGRTALAAILDPAASSQSDAGQSDTGHSGAGQSDTDQETSRA